MLVTAFFLTLNFNHKKLYAPSDYKDEKHFMNFMEVATRDEAESKLKEELKEEAQPETSEAANADYVGPSPSTGNGPDLDQEPLPPYVDRNKASDTSTDEASRVHSPAFDVSGYAKNLETESLQELESIEKSCLLKLKIQTQIPFKRHVKLEAPNFKAPLLFDAIGVKSNTIHVAEIKLFKSRTVSMKRLFSTFERTSEAAELIQSSGEGKVVLHLVIVVEADISISEIYHIKNNALMAAKRFGLKPEVYVTTRESLGMVQWPFA